MASRKSRKQKEIEYKAKYGDIPISYKDRLEWMYDKYNITEEKAFDILHKRDMMIDRLSYIETNIVLFEVPEGCPRPRARLINRENVGDLAKNNPVYIHIYSLTGHEDNVYMKRLMSNEDFDNLNSLICTPSMVDIHIFSKTPSQYNNQDKILAEIGAYRPISAPDWDNFGKKYSDMFNLNVWLDDSLAIDGAVHKFYSILPRIEIKLRYLNMLYNKHQYNSVITRTGYKEEYNLDYFKNFGGQKQ